MRCGLALALVIACGGSDLAAQQPRGQARASGPVRNCVVLIDSTGREGVFYRLPGRNDYQAFAGGGVFGHCDNDAATTMQADSLAWYPERGEAVFVRSVRFQDSTQVLEADRLTYFVRQERLYAEGNVRTRNLRSGSSMTGPNLEYLRARPPLRDTAVMYATRRPTVRFYSGRRAPAPGPSQGDSARADTTEPFVIVADRARMRGNDQMWGGGRVTVDRSDLSARADSAMLDLGADRGLLLGGPPTVEGKGDDSYRLTGTRIAFGLGPDDELRRVVASGEADATGSDWHLTADTLDLALDSSRVERALAWGRGRRPYATSASYRIVADSLDIVMPAQVMREVWAFGDGRATTRPDSAADEDDWMTGDTLHAVFEPRDSAAGDSTARGRQELRRLTALGSARSLYHVIDEQHRDERPGVNYSRGRRIEIAMREGKVATVDVVGQVDGVYLEPIRRRVAADTAVTGAAADSVRTGAAPAAARAPGGVPDTSRTRPPPDTVRAPARPAPVPPPRVSEERSR